MYLPAANAFYHFDSSLGRNQPAAELTAVKFWQMLGKTGALPANGACLLGALGCRVLSFFSVDNDGSATPYLVPLALFCTSRPRPLRRPPHARPTTYACTGRPVVDVCVASPQQENGYDCGMFAAAVARHLAHAFVTAPSSSPSVQSPRLDTSGLRARVTQDYVDEFRRRAGKRVRELASELGEGGAVG